MDSRVAIAALVLSATGLVYIAQREGYSEQAYADPVHGAQVPTAGFGATGPDITMGSTLAPVRALVRLRADASEQEVALRHCLGDVALLQREWDALVGLAYNTGATSVCKNNARTGPSTIVRRLQAGDYAGACDAFLLYDRAGPVRRPQDRCSHPDNRTCRGVWTDRQRLRAMCLGEALP
jgi:GH24 family phage-related lysozyme (muramidase)